MRKSQRWLCATAGIVIFSAQPAWAHEDAPGDANNSAKIDAAPDASASGGNDIMVTAQRREQTLQDVPIAISAIGEVALKRQEVVNTDGLLRLFPNVSGAEITGAGANNYSIRGLSNAATTSTFDSPVGTYVDGIYMARTNANNFALFDVQRVEVLRGPQGTLFGRNTTGGAINIVLKKPGNEFDGNFEASYGSFDRKTARGAIDVPVSDHIRTRLAAYWMDENGWAKNLTTGGHDNAHNGWGVRGSTSIDISPSVTWDGAVSYIHDENANLPVSREDGRWVTHSGLEKLGSIVTGRKGRNKPNVFQNDTLGLVSRFTIDSAIGKVSIITGYSDLHSRYSLDYFDNPAAIGGYDAVQYSTHRQFTQEENVAGTTLGGKLDYTVGLFYFQEKNMQDVASVLKVSTSPYVIADRTIYNDTSSFAAYGQFDYHLTDHLTATAGARWTADVKHISYEDNDNPLSHTVLDNAVLETNGIPRTQKKTIVTPRFVLSYKVDPDLSFYVSATNGFKSGGWNTGTTVATLGAFKAEQIWSYEAGMRSQLFDRKLAFNLTGFYGYTKDLQLPTAVASATGGAPEFPTGNFADFRSYGLEVEANYTPMPGVNIFANGGWDKTSYANPTDAVRQQQAACQASLAAGAGDTNCGNGIVRLNGTIAGVMRAPEFTATLGFSWEIPLGDQWNIVPSASGRYVSSTNVNSADLPSTYDNGYFLLAGSLGLERADGRMSFSFGCENCTNSTYLVSVISGYSYFSSPRRWTLRGGYKF